MCIYIYIYTHLTIYDTLDALYLTGYRSMTNACCDDMNNKTDTLNTRTVCSIQPMISIHLQCNVNLCMQHGTVNKATKPCGAGI